MINELTFQPDWVSSPGDTICDILRERSESVSVLAAQMDVSKETLQGIIDGCTPITISLARKLEQATGASVQFWMTRERNYQLALSQQKALHRSWIEQFPVREMVRLGWIEQLESRRDVVAACLQFFGAKSIPEWRMNTAYDSLALAFRRSPTISPKQGAVRAWLRQSEIQAGHVQSNAWDPERFQARLPEIRSLTLRKKPQDFLPRLQSLCADCGVVLVVVRAPSGCPVSGATWFLNENKAVISLTFRFRSDDQFWFTFFHEAAHLILHAGAGGFLEGIDSEVPDLEREANEFAARVLIPPEYESRLRTLTSNSRDIIRFAVKIGVSPGIVVGQLRYRRILDYNQQSRLIRRYDWPE